MPAPDVRAAMLVKRTIAKLELHFSIILAPSWPSYHVSEINEWECIVPCNNKYVTKVCVIYRN